MTLIILQWLGAITGVTGSYYVGSQIKNQRLAGFILFLFSNSCWIVVAYLLQTWGLLAMNLAFTATSIRGCYQNRLPPKDPDPLESL